MQVATNLKSNPKSFWSYVKSKTYSSKKIPDLSGTNTKGTTDSDKAEVLS